MRRKSYVDYLNPALMGPGWKKKLYKLVSDVSDTIARQFFRDAIKRLPPCDPAFPWALAFYKKLRDQDVRYVERRPTSPKD